MVDAPNSKFFQALQQASQHMEQQQAEQQAKEVRRIIVEMTSISFDRAATYNNVIIAAGFAGLFALWNFVSDSISEKATLFVGISIGVSLVAFVFFEVYKMTFMAIVMRPQINLIRKPLEPKQFLKEFQELQTQQRTRSLKWVYVPWIVVLFVSVAGGLFAAGLLLYHLSATLLSWPQWPA